MSTQMQLLGQPHDRVALVLYGSETGNAQDLAEELGRLLERLRFVVRVSELDHIKIDELLHYSIVIFSISTTGQGDLPRNSQVFWKRLRSTRLSAGCLSSLIFASFGLGDSSYPKYNWAHRKLFNRLSQLGASPICERGESDEQHPEGIEGCFLPWLTTLRQTLETHFPLPYHLLPIPDEEFLVPKWAIQLSEQSSAGTAHASGLPLGQNGHESLKNKDNIDKSGWFVSTLLKNERLTPPNHWQDVRLFEFSSPWLSYAPGDVLTIFPHNSSDTVDHFLDLMDWTPHADSPLEFFATQDSDSAISYPPRPFNTAPSQSQFTLRRLLTEFLDIIAIPRRSFFSSIAHFTDDETQKERLLEFTNPDYVDELYDYTTRPRRSIFEVLQEFHTVKIPYKWAAAILPHIKGRQFSIASGGHLKFADDGTGRIQLLVAIVKYKTVIKKIREGLCTKYLANLSTGTEIRVLFCKGGMKHTNDRSAVMVGPGTGVAPLRSMMHERVWHNSSNSSPLSTHNLLFFGGRSKDADYFFEKEWEALASSTGLQVHTAFSRDQKNKIYVQDVIREQSPSVYAALREGVVYICGSSGKMPQAVREALIEVFEKEAAMARADAEAHLVRMEKEGRYQQETW